MKPGDLITITKFKGNDVEVKGQWVSIFREPSGDSGTSALIEGKAVGLLISFNEKTHWGLCLFSGLRIGWINSTYLSHA